MIGMGLAWVAIVVLVSALTWTVIDAAGRDVLAADDSGSLTVDGTTGSAEPSTPTASEVTPDGSTSPSVSRGSTAPSVPEQVRSWRGAGGTVTVACADGEVGLRAVSPSNGWRVEVKERGPVEVEVELESQGDEGAKTEVTARCDGGVAAFRAEVDD